MVRAERGNKYWVAAKTSPYQWNAEPCTREGLFMYVENKTFK